MALIAALCFGVSSCQRPPTIPSSSSHMSCREFSSRPTESWLVLAWSLGGCGTAWLWLTGSWLPPVVAEWSVSPRFRPFDASFACSDGEGDGGRRDLWRRIVGHLVITKDALCLKLLKEVEVFQKKALILYHQHNYVRFQQISKSINNLQYRTLNCASTNYGVTLVSFLLKFSSVVVFWFFGT